MTKEAKIGMLTGLGVIVLIGVLLSEYLGDKNPAGGVANVPTGRMAPLPVGAAYREQLTSPIGVPAMAPAGPVVQLAGGAEIATPVSHDTMVPPVMVAAEGPEVVGGVIATGPVTPIDAGPVVADSRTDGGVPVISLKEAVPVKLPESKPTTVTHTIVAGDNLAKIAKQYYGSAKNSDVQKIVAANKGLLKDATTMLVVDKKLVIPGVVPAAPVAAQSRTVSGQVRPGVRPATPPSANVDGVMVYLPSSSMTEAVPLPPAIGPVQPPKKVEVAKPEAPKADNKVTAKKSGTYVVQSGDTLEKIARKIAPSRPQEMVQKLMSLNGIKDPTRLQAGVPLKVPV